MPKKKISISQCMSEFLCSQLPTYSGDEYLYLSFADAFNKLTLQSRELIAENLREYLSSCIGSDNVED